MLIAQITDLHIGPDKISELNDARLNRVVARVQEAAPDLILATGDLTEDGDLPSYQRLRTLLAPLSAPVLFCVGNHDLRDGFIQAFDTTPVNDGFIQYAAEIGGLRVIVLDTVEPDQHGGAFCERRAAWLAARLDEQPNAPTLIALHHPPVRSGIVWMDKNADGAWSRRLAEVLTNRPQIIGLVAGHIHRPAATVFAGHPLIVAPSCAPAVVLDLSDAPGGAPRVPRIVEEEPGFALHLWTGHELISHFGAAADHRVIASFDVASRRMVAS